MHWLVTPRVKHYASRVEWHECRRREVEFVSDRRYIIIIPGGKLDIELTTDHAGGGRRPLEWTRRRRQLRGGLPIDQRWSFWTQVTWHRSRVFTWYSPQAEVQRVRRMDKWRSRCPFPSPAGDGTWVWAVASVYNIIRTVPCCVCTTVVRTSK